MLVRMELDPNNVIAAGRLLRAARGRRKTSVVAEHIGVTESKYLAMEEGHYPRQGRQEPRPVRATADEYKRAASVLGIDPHTLFETLGAAYEPDKSEGDPYALGKLLRDRRAELGLSQARLLALRGGLSNAMISKYEMGEYLPVPESMKTLAYIYDLPLAALEAAVRESWLGRVDLRMPAKYARLTEKQRAALYAFADSLLEMEDHRHSGK